MNSFKSKPLLPVHEVIRLHPFPFNNTSLMVTTEYQYWHFTSCGSEKKTHWHLNLQYWLH